MELQSFTVKTRSQSGKGPARQIRMKGAIPGILYGDGAEPLQLIIDSRNFDTLIQGQGGAHAVVQLDVEDDASKSTPALIKGIQRHPVQNNVVHADFFRISLDKRIQTSVSLVVVGNSKGVLDGGVLEQQLREVEIECLAINIPDSIEVDVTELDIGDGLHMGEIAVSEDYTVLTDADRSVVSVHAPRVIEEPVEEGEGEEGEEGEEGAEGAEGEGEEASEGDKE
jgi:large subunit ribosomal protein L25